MATAAEHNRCRDCGWKVTYESKNQAKKILNKIQDDPNYRPRRKFKARARLLEVYKCPWSDGYHIGHHSPK